MNTIHVKTFLLFVFLLLPFVYIPAQEITIGNPVRGKFDGGKDKARIDFISSKNDLIIEENNGEVIEQPVRTPDGNYRYTCICDVIDSNLFGFNFSVLGGSQKEFIKVYVEEGELCEYSVSVADLPYVIGEVKVNNMFQVVPKEKTAAVTVSTNFKGLIIRSATGEQVQPPTMNESTSMFEFIIYYDLSEEGSEQISRTLTFAAGNSEPVPHELGPLAPKQGVEMAVLVVQEASCYEAQIKLAKNTNTNGMYLQSYQSFNAALKCDDLPDDKKESIKKEAENALRMAAALKRVQANYEKAEDFRQRNRMDSCIHYHQDAYKYRVAILKVNPSDPYCLEYQGKYERIRATFPRIISGTVLNNIRMDAQGNNLPMPNANVVALLYKTVTREVNHVKVEELSKKPEKEGHITFDKTDEKGNFRVFLPRNPRGYKYVLAFGDGDNFSGNHLVRGDIEAVTYLPTDADLQENLIIRIAPRLSTVNSNKK